MFLKYNKKQKAFTLMEVMMAVTVIGILFVLLRPGLTGMMNRINTKTTKMAMGNVKSALQQFKLDVKRYPTTKEGLEALIDKNVIVAKDREKWEGPYGDKNLPEDSWGHSFEYGSPPRVHKGVYKAYELYSLGPSGEEGNDDIVDGE
jgi:general secretion pathway protein G